MPNDTWDKGWQVCGVKDDDPPRNTPLTLKGSRMRQTVGGYD